MASTEPRPRNLIHLFENSVQKYGSDDCFAFKKGGSWRAWSWDDLRLKVRSLSAALQEIGVGRGDRISILSSTRPEWTLADLAILSLGAISVPIYQSNLTDEVEFILENSAAKGVFVENRTQLNKVLEVRDHVPKLEFIIMIDGRKNSPEEDLKMLGELLKTDPEKANNYLKNLEELDDQTVASYVYTSGTTGKPKGAILTHGNFVAEIVAVDDIVDVKPSDVSLAFLPLAHILARAIQFYQLAKGFTFAFAESIEKLADNILEVRPDFLVSVPRIFEKVYERILSQVHASSAVKQSLFAWAKKVGSEYSQAKQKRKPVPIIVGLQYLLASQLVFKKIRDRLGGRMRFAVSGGAPMAKEIAEFFHAVGILILEGYGLTETTAAINVVTKDRIEFGVVGPSIKGIEEKIAEDGEILVRGDVVFKGYYKNEKATREVLDEDGWFHTGDIGEFTKEGSLKITDRKKDIIVTAGGKNIAPQMIENLIKTNKYISQVVVHGDKRKYLTALITLNEEEIGKYAADKGLSTNGGAPLVHHPEIYNLVKKIIDQRNKNLPSFETIKRFAILENDFTQEKGELTPSLKVKRRFVAEKYADILDKLYHEGVS